MNLKILMDGIFGLNVHFLPRRLIFQKGNNKCGLFPHDLLKLFINELLTINPNIIITETILSPKGEEYDKLVLYNVTREDL
jgi:hypothetical protein